MYCSRSGPAGVTIPARMIAANRYAFRLAMYLHEQGYPDHLEGICPVQIHGTRALMVPYEGLNYGAVILPCAWARVR